MSAPRKSSGAVVAALLVAAVLIAGVLSNFASTKPDGLERVAEDSGFAMSAKNHVMGGGPLADYQFSSVSGWLSGSLAGIVGVLVVALIATGLFLLLRPKNETEAPTDTHAD